MSENLNKSEAAIATAKNIWDKNSKTILGICVAVIVLGAGWLGYKYLIKAPKERKAAEALYKAEEYFRQDSLNLAITGDGQYAGLENIAKEYGGTDAGNLAKFYAGVSYLQQNNFEKAVESLKGFSSDSKPVQARAYKLLADAYGDLGKNSEALSNYKKAANHFTDDKAFSAEALFHAAYFADKVMKDKNEAVKLYKELKQKYPLTQQATDVDKYLAQLGEYNVN